MNEVSSIGGSSDPSIIGNKFVNYFVAIYKTSETSVNIYANKKLFILDLEMML